MVKAKAVEPNKTIDKHVIDGYKQIETAIVRGCKRIADAFETRYLRHKKERVSEVKERLNQV